MDFKAEMEAFQQSLATRISKQTDEINKMLSSLAELEGKISKIEVVILQHRQKHAKVLEDIATKKELITQWKAALLEHETKLRANESLVNIDESLEQNQEAIDQSLHTLGAKKVGIEDAIANFKKKHPYINSTTEQSLQDQLNQREKELADVQNRIDYLLVLEAQLNIFVKLFLTLLVAIGWRTDPKAAEQNTLDYLSREITAITQSIQAYAQIHESLELLQREETTLVSETIQVLHQKSTLIHLIDTRRAISESKQTIKALQQQITNTSEQCATLTRDINNKSYLKTIAPLESLRQEQSEKLALLQVKNKDLALMHHPERTALKNQLAASLITIASDRAAYLSKKELAAQSSQFFKSLSTDNLTTTANFNALTKLPISINKYANGLHPKGPEARTLSSIASKLVLWQIAENTTNLGLPFSARMQAHQVFQEEMQALTAKLPIDNPLNGAQHLIQNITTPVQPAPPEPRIDWSSDTTTQRRNLR